MKHHVSHLLFGYLLSGNLFPLCILVPMILLPLRMNAQISRKVGACLQTPYQYWTLDSISQLRDSVQLHWTVQGKVNSWFTINRQCHLVDCKSGKKFLVVRADGGAIEPARSIVERDEKVHITEYYGLPDTKTECVDFRYNDSFYVNGIQLHKGGYTSHAVYRDPLAAHNDSVKLSDKLYNLGMMLYSKKLYSQAISMFREVSRIDSMMYSRPLLGNLLPPSFNSYLFNYDRPYENDYAKMWMGSCYHKLGNDSMAIKCSQLYWLEPFHRSKVKKADSLRLRYPVTMMSPKIKDKAIEAHREALRLDSLEFGGKSYRFIKGLMDLASVYGWCNDIIKKKFCLERAIGLTEAYIERPFSIYKNVVCEYALACYNSSDYVGAIKWYETLLNYGGVSDITFIEQYHLQILIESYLRLGEDDKALYISEKQIRKEKGKNDRFSFAVNYAMALYRTGYYKESIRQWRKIVDKIESYKYHLYMADAYMSLYDFEHAESCLLEAQRLYSESVRRFPKIYTNRREITPYFATVENRRGNYAKAIAYQKEILKADSIHRVDLKTTYFSRNYNRYQSKLSSLAFYYLRNNQCDSTILCENYNIKETERAYGNDSSMYRLSYLNLGEAYAMKGDYKKALNLTEKAYRCMHNNSVYLRRCLTNLVKYNFECNRMHKAKECLILLNSENTGRTRFYLSNLTSNERAKYWNNVSKYYNDFLPKYTYLLASDTLTSVLYNAVLDSKNILLNSELNFKKSILEEGKPEVEHLYYSIQQGKRRLMDEYKRGKDRREDFCDSVIQKVNLMEDELLVASRAYSDQMKYEKASWRDIQKKLGRREVAVEFLEFEMGKDAKIYAALLIDDKMEYPRLVKLFDSDVITSLSPKIGTDIEDIGRLVWNGLSSYIRHKKVIYFSPVGMLHLFNIEDHSLVKRKEVYRLSTTKELIKTSQINGNKDASLFGGLDYNYKWTGGNDSLLSEKKFVNAINASRGIEQSDLRGKQFGMLPFSEIEIDSAKVLLETLDYNCTLYKKKEGTESRFKDISGKPLSILHLATHGGFITPKGGRPSERDKLPFILCTEDFDQSMAEDVNLTHSFLVMAGANRYLSDKDLSDYAEDGILTAQEISLLDFRGLKLVVLSACHSGSGMITANGVMGLQRGFKKAGAGAIMMSLDSVDDYVTFEFMSLFYESLSEGMKIRQAFEETKEKMRKKYKDNPKCWKTFVLLDAV